MSAAKSAFGTVVVILIIIAMTAIGREVTQFTDRLNDRNCLIRGNCPAAAEASE